MRGEEPVIAAVSASDVDTCGRSAGERAGGLQDVADERQQRPHAFDESLTSIASCAIPA